MNSKKQIFPRLAVIVSVLALIISYQNCSKVEVVDLPQQAELSSVAEPLSSQIVETKVGQSTSVPDLKLVFVVDNSYSMRANNIKLSDSFQQLFQGESSRSLTPFKADVMILNTAQNSVATTEAGYDLLPTKSISSFSSRNPASFGEIPGDIIGYRVQHQTGESGTFQTSYQAAPVVGFQNQKAYEMMSKAANGNVAALSEEFQSRLKNLNADLVGREYDGFLPLDEESGLCGMARMLKESNRFFKPGEQVGFIVVSDEDDINNSASKCIESYEKVLEGSVIDGRCESVETSLFLEKDQTKLTFKSLASDETKFNFKETYKRDGSCIYDYATGVNYQLKKSVVTTDITYFSKDENCRERDGLKVCDGGNRTRSVSGDFSTNCTAGLAKVNDNSAVVTAALKCSKKTSDQVVDSGTLDLKKFTQLPAVGNCSSAIVKELKDAGKDFETCQLTMISRSGRTEKLEGITGNITSVCQANSTAICQNSNGLIQDCKVTIRQPTATVVDRSTNAFNGKLTCQTSCRDPKAKGVCSSDTVDRTIAKDFELEEGYDGSSCVAEVKTNPAGVTTTAQVDGNFSCQSLCKDTGYCPSERTLTVAEFVRTKENKTCENSQSGIRVSVSSPDKRDGVWTCDQVASSYVGKNRYCKNAVVGQKVVSTFSARNESERPKLCKAGETLVVTKGPYSRPGGIVKNFVVGNNGDKPKMTLTDYIKQRSEQLFGKDSLFISVFVIKPGESLGQQQSVGRSYINLANLLGGQIDSINTPDYSAAFQNLGGIIKAKLDRSIKISQLRPDQKVRQVWWKRGNGSWGQPLDPQLWSSSGNTVTMGSQLDLAAGDDIRVEFY